MLIKISKKEIDICTMYYDGQFSVMYQIMSTAIRNGEKPYYHDFSTTDIIDYLRELKENKSQTQLKMFDSVIKKYKNKMVLSFKQEV